VPRRSNAEGKHSAPGAVRRCWQRAQYRAHEGQVTRLPVLGDDARRIFQLREPSTHSRCGLDRSPATIRRAQRASELAAAGADIEQVADLAHAATDDWRNSHDEVGGVDGCDVELDRISALRRADGASRRRRRNGWPRSTCVAIGRDGHENIRGNDPSPRTAAVSPYRWTVRCDRSGHIRTPRLLRPRVTPAVAGLLAHGSSPSTTFPGARKLPVACRSQARRLQLRGQPRHCAQMHAPRSLLIPFAGTTADHPYRVRRQRQSPPRVRRNNCQCCGPFATVMIPVVRSPPFARASLRSLLASSGRREK
jgi:hypothetical protein